MTTPNSLPADGNLKVVWVPTIADTAAPSAAILNGATSIDLSCYLTADGYSPGGDEASITDDRLCSRQTFERPGRSSDTLDLMYVYQAQAAAAAADNKAFDTLKHLTTGYIVTRWGKDYALPFIATDKVDVLPAQCGKQMKSAPEANSILKVAQKVFVTSTMKRDAAVVA